MIRKSIFILCLYLILAAVCLLAAQWFTDFSLLEKLLVSAAFAVTGIIDCIVRLVNHSQRASLSGPVAGPVSEPAKVKKIIPLAARAYDIIIGLAVLIIIIGLFAFLLWLILYARDATKEIVAKAPQTRIIEGLLIGHSYDLSPDKEYSEWISPGTIYNVFPLEAGQHWKWYFDQDIEYRISQTGQERFELVDRARQNGLEKIANYAGLLQIKSATKRNHVTAARFIPRSNK